MTVKPINLSILKLLIFNEVEQNSVCVKVVGGQISTSATVM